MTPRLVIFLTWTSMETMMAPPSPPPLSPRQLSSLKAIINALLPSLPAPEDENSADVHEFWSYELSNDDDFLRALTEAIQVKLNSTERMQLKLFLTALSNTVASSIVFGIPSTTPFSQWSASEQTRALQKLQHGRLTLHRNAFSGVKRLVCGLAFSFVNSETNRNPFWKAMEYPGPPPAVKNIKPDFDTGRAFLEINQDATLEYDVVIVGSGAGGGVAAAILSHSGYNVLVLEKGPYVPPSEVTNLECQALDSMYEKHSLLTTNDGNIMILAGSTLGGGTTVNWACCLPLPDKVREEWIHKYGLTQFGSSAYEESLLAVQERIGCLSHDKVTHNLANQKMKKGCNVMGYECETTGQNLRDTSQTAAGYVCFGDAERNKQSGLVTFLSDAVEADAKILQHAEVQRVLFETEETDRKRAVGVVATVNGQHQVQVLARKCVIVAAGSLNSPCLLQRSGFRNPHIGHHLHLHPVTAAFGFCKETIHSYLGAPMTTVCSDFPNAKLESPCAHTGLLAAGLPFCDPFDFKSKMLRLKHAVTFIVLQRDVVSEGRVRVGADGFSPSIDYTLKEADKQNMMDALKGAIKVLIASGAKEVGTGHINDTGLYLLDEELVTAQDIESSDKVRDYLTTINERGMTEHEIGVFSAHQMSTCRMSASPASGVVDANGETWECDNLMVFDASIFPTASGANPMVTTLAVSHMLCTRLAERLHFEDNTAENSTETVAWMNKRGKMRAIQPRYVLATVLHWAALTVVVISVGIVKYRQERL